MRPRASDCYPRQLLGCRRGSVLWPCFCACAPAAPWPDFPGDERALVSIGGSTTAKEMRAEDAEGDDETQKELVPCGTVGDQGYL